MLNYATYTDIGTRSVNEDSLGVYSCNDKTVFVVCDGLGGHSCGDLASKTAVDAICSSLNESSDIENFVTDSIDNAQRELVRVQNEIPTAKKMRTTAVVLFTDGKSFRCGHIGDSRIYLFGKNGEKTRTKDHSIPQVLALTGEISEDEIRFHPDRNLILKALGNEGNAANSELGHILDLDEYEAFLLCTDGFWEYISDEQISSTLVSSDSSEQWMNKMTKIVTKNTKNKNADNRTAIAVFNRG